MAETSRVVKAAAVVGSATLASRILGFIRDAVIAWFFGAGFSSDAFIAAFRIPNLLRRLFAEGSLSSAFVPVFTECVLKHGQTEAFNLARAAFRLLGCMLIIVTVCGILLSPWIVRLIAPGFSADKLSLTIRLTQLMFPYIFFIGLVALSMGILNVLGHFAAPAFAPLLLNLAIIGSVFFISPALNPPVFGLAVGVLIGGILQLLLQLPVLIDKGVYFWQTAKIMHPELKRVGVLILPVIMGGAVYQINILIGTMLGSLLTQGSVTYLYFADRLVQFPLGVFAIATATAVLPSLSRQATTGDFDSFKDTFTHTLKLVFFITIPAAVGLVLLREPIVALLFERGEFDARATQLTAQALLYYSMGLWAFSAVRVVVSTFFAMQDTKTPLKLAAISILANVVLGIVLMKPFAHGGLALATSLASMINLVLLLGAFRNRMGALGWRNLAASIGRSMICTLLMGGAVSGAAALILPKQSNSLPELIGGVAGCIAVGIGIYGAASYFLKSPELRRILVEAGRGISKK